MMILSGTKTLTASLAAAPATTQPTFVVAYAEVNAIQVTEDTNEVTATGTTPVTVLSAPSAGFRRVIKSLFVTNLDTVPTTVTVFINGFPAGKATIGSGLSVDLASSTAIPVSQGQVATGTLMGNNSGVSNLPFALSATASLTLLGIPGLQTSGITGNLTLSKTGTTARTQTARDASGNLCLDSVNNGFTVLQSIDRGTGALPAPINAAAQCLTLSNIDATPSNIESFGYGTTGINLRGRSIGGTRAAPTASQDAQVFVNLVGTGYDGVSAHGDSTAVRMQADGLWSASNRGGLIAFFGIPNGGTIPAEWMRLQNASLGIGIAPTAGNGLVQLASGTTKANGVAHGDTYQFRAASGQIFQSGPAATDIIYTVQRSTGETLNVQAGSGVCVAGTSSNTPFWLRTNGAQCISMDTAQGVTTAAANYVKVRSVAASAGTTTLDATDATAILTGAAIHTFTLPAASNGRRLFIKNRSSLALTVNRAGADTIDGLTTIAVATGTAKILIANGTDWCVWNA
jgi:hypothetical protein